MSNKTNPYVPSGQPPRELSGQAKEAEEAEQQSRQEPPSLYVGERSQNEADTKQQYLRVFKSKTNGRILTTTNDIQAAAMANNKNMELVEELPL